jgi:LysM repeat protein
MAMRNQRIAGLCLVLVLLINGGWRTEAAAQADTASQLLQLVNQVRARHGLAPFQSDQALAVAAQNQAEFNAASSRYGHSGVGGSSPQDRANAAGYSGYVVENVVGGTDLTPAQGVTWWVNSPVHYNTLITTRYAFAGTGFATNGRQRHYVLVVGRPADGRPERAVPVASAPAFVAPIILSEPAADGSISHQVRVGQTLWAIAARYQVTLEELRLFNNLAEEALLRPGDKLIIRLAEGQEPPPTPTPPLTHIVREGETLWTIAARFRLNLADLFWLNGLNEDSLIQPGEEIMIRLAPGQPPPPTPTPQTSHEVQSGQSLWEIAALYGLSVEALRALNELDATHVLQPGDQLRIRPWPSPTATVTTVATATANGASLAEKSKAPETIPLPPPTPDQRAAAAVVVPPDSPNPNPGSLDSSSSELFLRGVAVLAIVLLLAGITAVIYIRRNA